MANLSVFIEISLQLGRLSHHSHLGSHGLKPRDSTFLFCHSHGTVTIKNHALRNSQPRGNNIAVKPRRRHEIGFLFGRHVTFHPTVNHHSLAGYFGSHFSSLSDDQPTLALDFPIYAAVDSSVPLKIQLAAYPASLVQRRHQSRLSPPGRLLHGHGLRRHGGCNWTWLPTHGPLGFRFFLSTGVSIKPSHRYDPLFWANCAIASMTVIVKSGVPRA